MKGASSPLESLGFLLSKAGAIATERMAEKLARHGLRPRHCGLLAMAETLSSASQEQLSRALGLVPSAIVTIVDDLEALGAIERVADPDNRRRYAIELTRKGHTLLARCTEAAQELDQELLATLTSSERAQLASGLKSLGVSLGIVPSEP